MSDNWKKNCDLILVIEWEFWVGILEVLKIHVLELKAFSAYSYCITIQLKGPFMFSRFVFFFKKLPNHLLRSYKQLRVFSLSFFTFNVFV